MSQGLLVLAKMILQGTAKGKTRKGRQYNRWDKNLKEWTGMDFGSLTRGAENRTRWWKGTVAKSSIVPLARLLDRIQSTLVISTSVISNNRLSRRENLIPV